MLGADGAAVLSIVAGVFAVAAMLACGSASIWLRAGIELRLALVVLGICNVALSSVLRVVGVVGAFADDALVVTVEARALAATSTRNGAAVDDAASAYKRGGG